MDGPGLVRLLTVPRRAGAARAVEIAANAILPVLAASGREAVAEAVFAELPLPAKYGSVRHLHSALGAGVRLSARRQQGMLYLLGQYCSQNGCGRCPLS